MEMIFKVLIICAALMVGFGSRYWFSNQEDNPIEEISEEIIKTKTGVDIDISPSSPENRY